MRALFLALILVLPGFSAAADNQVAAEDRAAIVQVIESQIEAFRADDGAVAFSFASPTIQQIFVDPPTFMRMVRNGYQPVYRPRSVEFLGTYPEGAQIVQEVYLVGPDGKAVIAVYSMQRQPDGSWRINGVRLFDPRDISA